MLLFWKWKELFVGYDLVKVNKCLDILVLNNIQYIVKAGNISDRVGSNFMVGKNSQRGGYSADTYYIYVKREDLEGAEYLIRKID